MIAIGCDHAGFDLKKEIEEHLNEIEIKFKDYGTFDKKSCDYPDYAKKTCEGVLSGDCELGILICGTGIGMSMAANKIKGIRAAACSDYFGAKFTREHNDANILCLGARVIGPGLACELVDVFINTQFSEGANHIRRISKLSDLDNLR